MSDGDDIASLDADGGGGIAPLIKRLRDKKIQLTMKERIYLADLLEGKFKPPAHRPASKHLLYKRLKIARYFLYLTEGMDEKYESAVRYTATALQFRRTESSIRNDIAVAKKHWGVERWNRLKKELKLKHRYERLAQSALRELDRQEGERRRNKSHK